MSIFDATPLDDFTLSLDAIERLWFAFTETMNAITEAKNALARAEKAAQGVGAYASFRLDRADERDVVASFWKAFIRSHPAYAVMAHDRRQTEVDEWVESYDYRSRGQYPRPFPEFTIASMMEKDKDLWDRSAFFLREWALTLFRRLITYPETPQDVRIPERVRVSSAVDSSHRVTYGQMVRDFADLDRLFHYLDGRKMEDENPYHAPLVEAIGKAKETRSGETDYFRFRTFLNGNVQLTFKRRDLASQWEALAREGLVERMNH